MIIALARVFRLYSRPCAPLLSIINPPTPPLTRTQESTLGVELVAESQRKGAGGALLYDYEYELNSTRGRKRILNTVSITGARARAHVGRAAAPTQHAKHRRPHSHVSQPPACDPPVDNQQPATSNQQPTTNNQNPSTYPGSKLYILNGQFKCDKEACGRDDTTQSALETLRRVAGSFDAGN
jgi:hypothetical protein